jgi:Tfp pilus assembly protein PilF
MKKYFFLFYGFFFLTLVAAAQTEDPKTLHENAKTFMRQGDFNNAIIILTRALQMDKNNLEMLKDLAMSYYYKRDYEKALGEVKILLDRDDADVIAYQIGGNVYKALEEVKEAEKVYKKGLKKFPASGPLYSEYGELLWAKKDFSAIGQWEKGIQVDPGYSGNYYNAALFYFYTKDKVWSLIYGEIFVNMESLSDRGAAMKQLLLQGYKEKLFAAADIMAGEEKNKNEFSRAFLDCMGKQSSLTNRGVTTETLTMIRSRFILEWFDKYAGRFPYKLFDYQRQLLQEGIFTAYNEWLFGTVENLAAYDTWTKTHDEEYKNFTAFQKTRVFKMPTGQYYQDK